MVPTMIRLFLTSLLLASLSVQAGDVYRWVDEQGNVHYSETPPPGQQAEQTGVRTRTTGTGISPQTVDEAAPERPDDDAESDEATAEGAPEQDPEVLAEIRRQNCERAREGMETLDSYNRVRVEEDGEQRFLTPEEMEEQRERLQGIIDENC